MNFKKNYIYFINIAMIILIMIGDGLYIASNLLLCKSITSALFVVLGIINLIYAFTNGECNKKFSIIILVGLFFAMLGDILLEINFMIGAIFFAIGHIFFFVSYMFIMPFKRSDLFYGLAIILPAILLITLAPLFDFGSTVMELLCVVYAIVISFMLGKAMANLVNKKTNTNIVVFLGSFLFFFSDLMLLFNVFGSGAKVFSYLCLLTYYPAEILLAISILVASVFYEKEKTLFVTEKQVRAELNSNNKEEKPEEITKPLNSQNEIEKESKEKTSVKQNNNKNNTKQKTTKPNVKK